MMRMEPENQLEPAQERPICSNCGKKMNRKGKFCPHCGQRAFNGKVRLSELFTRFFRQAFHLDNKILKMLWHLLVPARVTLAFFNGQIKRYPNPVQFFFVVMFFFLLLLSRVSERNKQQPVTLNLTDVTVDTLGRKQETGIRLTGDNFLNTLQHYGAALEMRQRFDSLPASIRTPEARMALDSLLMHSDPNFQALVDLYRASSRDSQETDFFKVLDTIPLNLVSYRLNVAAKDIVQLTADEIADKYGVEGLWNKTMLNQGLKTFRDPEALSRTYLGSFTWTILALVALMAAVLRLLFRRTHPFYAEHFIFLLHQHTGAFLVLTFGLAVDLIWKMPEAFWVLPVAWIWIALLLAMRRFYGYPLRPTVFKWLLYSALYGIAFVLLFIAGLLVVFMIF